MSLFRLTRAPETEPLIRGDGLYLRPAVSADFTAWAHLRAESRAFLTPWEPTWPADDLSRSAFRRRLRRYAEDQRSDQSYAFFLFRKNDHALTGGLTLANIRRGVAQAATLGYWMGARYAGKGRMTRAVAAATRYGFSTLRLHRIEAACLPQNIASISLLERNGFQREGFARAYLKIDGAWRDHVLYALIEHEAPRGF